MWSASPGPGQLDCGDAWLAHVAAPLPMGGGSLISGLAGGDVGSAEWVTGIAKLVPTRRRTFGAWSHAEVVAHAHIPHHKGGGWWGDEAEANVGDPFDYRESEEEEEAAEEEEGEDEDGEDEEKEEDEEEGDEEEEDDEDERGSVRVAAKEVRLKNCQRLCLHSLFLSFLGNNGFAFRSHDYPQSYGSPRIEVSGKARDVRFCFSASGPQSGRSRGSGTALAGRLGPLLAYPWADVGLLLLSPPLTQLIGALLDANKRLKNLRKSLLLGRGQERDRVSFEIGFLPNRSLYS